MRLVAGDTINDVYPQLVNMVAHEGNLVGIDRPEAVSNKTRELHPVMIEVHVPQERLVTSYGRPVNVAFMMAEVLWILAGRKDVEMLAAYNSTIAQFSDDGHTFNAAYGYRLRSSFGHDQIEDVIRTLAEDPTSRQATLIISNPVDDKGWNRQMDDNPDDPHIIYSRRQTKDRACNLMAHLLIRDGHLDWLQVVRSNDVMWGLPYNFMQFTHLQEYIATRLGVEMGSYYHLADSLHMYDHHFADAEQVRPFNLYEAIGGHEHPLFGTSDEIMNIVLREELLIRTGRISQVRIEPADIGMYWAETLWLLLAHRQYVEGNDAEAWMALGHADPVYALAQARFYYQNRWYKDEWRSHMEHIKSQVSALVYEWMTTRVTTEA